MVVLCLATLVAVILDVTLFHSRSASAQGHSRVLIERVAFAGGSTGTAAVDGKVLGFTCVEVGAAPECFVASGWVTNNDK